MSKTFFVLVTEDWEKYCINAVIYNRREAERWEHVGSPKGTATRGFYEFSKKQDMIDFFARPEWSEVVLPNAFSS